jgi:hypothetical protein
MRARVAVSFPLATKPNRALPISGIRACPAQALARTCKQCCPLKTRGATAGRKVHAPTQEQVRWNQATGPAPLRSTASSGIFEPVTPAGSTSPPRLPPSFRFVVSGTSSRRRGAFADGSHREPGAAPSVAGSTRTRTTSKSSSSRARGYWARKAESPALRSSPRRTSAMARCRRPRSVIVTGAGSRKLRYHDSPPYGLTNLVDRASPRPSSLISCQSRCIGIAAHNARDRSTVGRWLALRPECSTQARMPPTAFLAPRGVRRGLLVLTAGLVPDSYRRYPTGPVASSLSRTGSPGPLPSPLPQWRDGKARR